MDIIVDSDREINYEVNDSYRKVLNYFLIPILNILPAQSKGLIQKSHKSVNEVVENVTTHKALEILYKKGYKSHTINWFQRLSHSVWFNTNNSKAVRNRILLVKRELSIAIKELFDQGKDVNILSIASGSARAIVESVVMASVPDGKKLSVVFLDKSQEALDYSKHLLEEFSFPQDGRYKFTWINCTAGSYLRTANSTRFNLVEMVGLLDYFDDIKAVSIFSGIKNILDNGGKFITANINYNSEERFMTRVIGWRMIYRSVEELGNLLLKSGFKLSQVKLFYEPLKIHGVAVVTKD